jgi:hypothetical protein
MRQRAVLAPHPRRSAADRGEYRQAAGAAEQVNVSDDAKPSSRRFPPPWSVVNPELFHCSRPA